MGPSVATTIAYNDSMCQSNTVLVIVFVIGGEIESVFIASKSVPSVDTIELGWTSQHPYTRHCAD